MPDEMLAHRTYEDLVSALNRLSDEIDMYRDMTPEQEDVVRRNSSADGWPLPDDFRSESIVQAGLRQVEIVRECLKRVDLGTLARDTGYPETSLILFACYRGDPPEPEAN